MKSLDLKTQMVSIYENGKLFFTVFILSFFSGLFVPLSNSSAQSVLFDFDNAPVFTSLPISQTESGITAHLAATGQGFSIQDANVLGFTPQGFAGHSIYPNSINLADLLISFDQTITDFSIMYSPQELGCDTSATMRVTAYMNGTYVGTDTRVASNPGTWPVDTLRCSFAAGFDSVVVHYESIPWPCQDFGVIFMADNMRVTPLATAISNPETFNKGLIIPNPVSADAMLSFSLVQSENISATIYDTRGKLIKNLFDGHLSAGNHQIKWNVNNDGIAGGIYLLRLSGENFYQCYKLVVVK